MADGPVLQVRGLAVDRGSRRVLGDIAFDAEAGVLLAVLGPNGAGKSTLLKAIAGLLPHQGEVLLAGHPGHALDRRARARLVAYVPQHSALDAALPARDVVEQGRFAHRGLPGNGAAADREAIARALAVTGTEHLAERPFDCLSYGERRLVLLARALATGAPLLLLDEPTAALDVRNALALMATLRRLAHGGATILVVLHQLQEAAASCDRALLLQAGRCLASGPIEEVIAAEPVRRAYGVDMLPRAQFGYRLTEEP